MFIREGTYLAWMTYRVKPPAYLVLFCLGSSGEKPSEQSLQSIKDLGWLNLREHNNQIEATEQLWRVEAAFQEQIELVQKELSLKQSVSKLVDDWCGSNTTVSGDHAGFFTDAVTLSKLWDELEGVAIYLGDIGLVSNRPLENTLDENTFILGGSMNLGKLSAKFPSHTVLYPVSFTAVRALPDI
eukprot:Protomagalhaensia_wolfi_Nauph_80__2632@NODE_2775_length_991_cov_52_948529_g2176_i0_p1_GENE_NODE_2775_length_991_cov_52_948529_g2176_i0NODE_2775_length_991_cov_52_948529_g2176_i0_p1_ORF_typecomplete_len185_score31_48_NODE_2775_length_991_cov_52_948529_g2176_i0340894